MDKKSPQARVLREVSRGAVFSDVIAQRTGLDMNSVRTALTRLRVKGYVQSRYLAQRENGQRGQRVAYEPVGVRCILADVWEALV